MTHKEETLISKEQLEADSVSNLNGLLSRLKFTDYTSAAEFLKNQLDEISVKYAELFSLEDMDVADYSIFKIKSVDPDIFCIILDNGFYDGGSFRIRYKESNYYFILKPRKRLSGYSIISFEGEPNPFNFDELVIDDFLKINLLDLIYKAIEEAFIEFKPLSK